ncbi:beta-lactamase family protein [Cohnella herbarum]|uniref:beta-lactamase family protein n=1 Tax=Cohnella herbarum TaxID=2728023 RepID=UPI0020C32BE2|nr:beta-lactamase family protein [Cohnella herbarum]
MTIRRESWFVPGSFGWDGGTGTTAYTDPANELIGILLTQRIMDTPEPPPIFQDFWTSIYQAIGD